MLPSEIPWVLHAGNGTRGPFQLIVDGTPITFADVAHIRVTRYSATLVPTAQVNGVHYDLSATSALPDLGDPLRPTATASLTLKMAQLVLAADEFLLIERIAPATQDLLLNQGGGYSARDNERTLDAIVRVIQQVVNTLTRGIMINNLDAAGALELPRAEDRASKFFTFDAAGNPSAISATPGLGDMLGANNLSDLADVSTARTNLGLNSAALLPASSFFQVANNLSECNAATVRSNIGTYSSAQVDTLFSAHIAAGDPHTQYLLDSAVSVNGLTLIGHTFAQMRTDLSLVIGANVQAWDADLDSWAAVTRSSGFDTFVATPSSANLRSLLTDETGTGAAVFANTPTLVTPNIGAATGTSLTLSGAVSAGGFSTFSSDIQLTVGADQYIYYDGAIHLAKNGTGDALTIDASRNVTLAGNLTALTANFAGGSPHVFNRTAVPQYIIQLNDNGTLRGYIGADSSYIFRASDPGGTSYLDVASAAIIVGAPVRLKTYTIAGLPAGAAGDVAYASNGRKNGEGAAAGTGVMVFKDGTAWRACDTGATAAA